MVRRLTIALAFLSVLWTDAEGQVNNTQQFAALHTTAAAGMVSFFDDFDAAIDTDRWTALTNGSGTVTQSGSLVTLADPGASSDVAALYLDEPVDRGKNWMACVALRADAILSAYTVFGLVDGTPVVEADPGVDYRTRTEIQSTTRFQVKGFTSSHTENYWRESTQDWSTSFGASYNDVRADHGYILCMDNQGRAAGNRYRWLGYGKAEAGASYTRPQGLMLNMVTDWRTWSGEEAVGDTLYLTLGFGDNDLSSNVDVDLDWFLFTTTNDTTIPDDNIVYLNMADDGSPSFPPPYEIGAFYTYDLTYPWYVPIDNDPIVVARGGGSAFDEIWATRPSVVKVSSTYYMTYDGRDAGGDTDLGCATASDPLGTWTKCTNNPIISSDGGTAVSTLFPYVMYNSADTGSEWRIFWSSETTSDEGIYYVEHSALDSGTWGSSTKKLSLGSGGSWDDFFLDSPRIYNNNSEWQMWYSGYPSATPWQGGAAVSSTLEGTYTKEGGNPLITSDNAATTTTDANSTGTTLNVTATTGFSVGQTIVVEVAEGQNHFDRIIGITAGASLQLWHGFDDIDSGINVSTLDDRSVYPMAFINYTGTSWWMLATCFRFGTSGVQQEASCMYEGTGTDLTAISWTAVTDPWGMVVPIMYFAAGTPIDYYFLENPAIITTTVSE